MSDTVFFSMDEGGEWVAIIGYECRASYGSDDLLQLMSWVMDWGKRHNVNLWVEFGSWLPAVTS